MGHRWRMTKQRGRGRPWPAAAVPPMRRPEAHTGSGAAAPSARPHRNTPRPCLLNPPKRRIFASSASTSTRGRHLLHLLAQRRDAARAQRGGHGAWAGTGGHGAPAAQEAAPEQPQASSRSWWQCGGPTCAANQAAAAPALPHTHNPVARPGSRISASTCSMLAGCYVEPISPLSVLEGVARALKARSHTMGRMPRQGKGRAAEPRQGFGGRRRRQLSWPMQGRVCSPRAGPPPVYSSHVCCIAGSRSWRAEASSGFRTCWGVERAWQPPITSLKSPSKHR